MEVNHMKQLPELTPIESSMFSGHAYDPATRKLTLQYKNGSVHEYDDVPMEKYETMVGNASPGRYFNQRIRGLHVSRKIT